MSAANTSKPTCFVVMGFGKKTDFETGRILDLDKSYANLIRPAVKAAGLLCTRADEIVHSGLIDVPMYERLLSADVVIADLSTSNKNAYYELGIRHALRPYTTIIIAEDGIKTFPFDINHVAVRQYRHLGEDIGSSEAKRFKALLARAIRQIMAQQPDERRDSPVYAFLHNLVPPALREIQQAAVAAIEAAAPRATNSLPSRRRARQLPATEAAPTALSTTGPTHAVQMAEVERHMANGSWDQACTLLEAVRTQQRQARAACQATASVAPGATDHDDPCLLQRLALATYKSRQPTPAAALQAARDLLAPLEPATTNDPETLGIWGAIHKHRWHLARQAAAGPGQTPTPDLDEAVRAYERAFYLRNDYYNGSSLALMLSLRAAENLHPAEAVADFVQAQRVRREVLDICTRWLDGHRTPPRPRTQQTTAAQRKAAATYYWVLAAQGQAYLGLGQDAEASKALVAAYLLAPETWMLDSTKEKMAKLRAALDANPLQHLQR